MKNHQKTGVWILALLVVVALFMSTMMFGGENTVPQQIKYSEFLQKIDDGQLKDVVISGNTAEALPIDAPEPTVSGTSDTPAPAATETGKPPTSEKAIGTATPAPDAKATEKATEVGKNDQNEKTPKADVQKPTRPALIRKYKVNLPEREGTDQLISRLEAHKIDFSFEPPQASGHWLGILTTIFLPLMILIFFIVLFRNAQGGGSQAMSFGKSRAKLNMDNKVKITFEDVAGIDEAKEDLEEIVDFLKNGERYTKLGAKIPRGMLLVGSPGTGKTLLAKAVAGESGVPFFSISGSDFVEMFVGVGASRVRDLFEQAKKHAPCIVFVDEIDAVGRQRGAGLGGGHDEREQTLNQLLVEMDGFDPNTGIIVLAATNRPDILDNALLRPGRFDRQVTIDRPDVKGREQILKVHAKGKPMAEDVDLKIIAKRTPGFTGADLSNLLNEGALLAARKNQDVVKMNDIENSIEKVLAGAEKKSKIISEKDKEITAYHEVGHALVAMLTPDCDPLRKLSIIPRGMALGLTWYAPDDAKVHTTKKQLFSRISAALGGRVAEEIVYGDVTVGAYDDLKKVSEIARKIVTQFGMSDTLGPVIFGKQNEHVFMGRDFGTERDYGEEVAGAIDREVKQIIVDQYNHTRTLLTDNRDMLEAITRVLLEKETIDDTEVLEIMDRVRKEREAGIGYNGNGSHGKSSEVSVVTVESTASSAGGEEHPPSIL